MCVATEEPEFAGAAVGGMSAWGDFSDMRCLGYKLPPLPYCLHGVTTECLVVTADNTIRNTYCSGYKF